MQSHIAHIMTENVLHEIATNPKIFRLIHDWDIRDYDNLVKILGSLGVTHTFDFVRFDDPQIDIGLVNDMLLDMR